MNDHARRLRSAPWSTSVLFVLTFVALWVGPSPTVCAQSPQETALARSLFEEGVAAADGQRWEEAADRFRRAHGLKPTPGVAFNWASALVELGRLVEAGELLRAIVRDAAADPLLRADSEAKLALVAPRIASLVIHVEGAREELVVHVDGRPLLREAWGVGSPTDPGAHTVSLLHHDELLASEQLVLADAERREVTLRAHGPAAAGVVTAPLATPVAEPREQGPGEGARRPLYKSWVMWTAVGVALVAGAVTTTLLLAKDDPAAPAPVVGNSEPGVIRW